MKCVETGQERLWVAASDGAIRVYEVNEPERESVAAGPSTPRPSAGPVRSPSGGGDGGESVSVSRFYSITYTRVLISDRTQTPRLELVDQLSVTINRKAADRMAVLPRLNKVAILSGSWSCSFLSYW